MKNAKVYKVVKRISVAIVFVATVIPMMIVLRDAWVEKNPMTAPIYKNIHTAFQTNYANPPTLIKFTDSSSEEFHFNMQDSFSTMLRCQNMSEKQTYLSKVTFHITELKKTPMPLIKCWIRAEDGENIEVVVTNFGDGNANNIVSHLNVVETSSQTEYAYDPHIERYFDKKYGVNTLDSLLSGETIVQTFYPFDKILEVPIYPVLIGKFELEMNYDNKIFPNPDFGEEVGLLITEDGVYSQFLSVCGQGDVAYGTYIDFNNNNLLSVETDEKIDPKKYFDIPICIFANESCTFNFVVELEFEDSQVVFTEKAKVILRTQIDLDDNSRDILRYPENVAWCADFIGTRRVNSQ